MNVGEFQMLVAQPYICPDCSALWLLVHPTFSICESSVHLPSLDEPNYYMFPPLPKWYPKFMLAHIVTYHEDKYGHGREGPTTKWGTWKLTQQHRHARAYLYTSSSGGDLETLHCSNGGGPDQRNGGDSGEGGLPLPGKGIQYGSSGSDDVLSHF